MSEEIGNREYRQNVIRELLAELHAGRSVDEVKAKFEAAFDGVSASEISEAEQALIAGGMAVEEVQRLCDVHAAVFRDSLTPENPPADEAASPGHPAHTLREENRALERLLDAELRPAVEAWQRGGDAPPALLRALEALRGITRHYQKKENLLFPYMERRGITGPPKVMWGVDDEIRSLIKRCIELAGAGSPSHAQFGSALEETITKITEMVFKEENILLPMLDEVLSAADWKRIADESDEIGYFLIPKPPVWSPAAPEAPGAAGDLLSQPGSVILPTGVLRLEELTRMLDALPIDITFVDKDDTVKYFSQGAERVFPRTKSIIGRKVANCHPPASVHIVEGILDDFKSGKKVHEDFWIKMGGKYILIRYFAVRDEGGGYLGALEVTQNIAPIQAITGEKRLVEN